jgi:hypothetical protein
MLAAKFPVPMVVGPHPFPFRTRQLSPLTPMVLQPQGCWESRKAPDYSNGPVARNRGRLFSFSTRFYQACPDPLGSRLPRRSRDTLPHARGHMRDIVLPEVKPALEWIGGRAVQKASPQRK